MKKFLLAVVAACAALSWSTVWAWQPTRPVTVLIGFAPGSGNEMSFRAVAQQVEKETGAKFVITNQPGADAALSLNNLVAAAPDGYTINVASQQGTWVMADVLSKNLIRFTPDSFEYTVNIAKSPLALIAPISSAVNTPAEFLRLIENTDRQINIAVGASSHKLAYEYVMAHTRARKDQVTAVNYRGPAPAGVDVAGGQVDFGIIPAAVAYGLVKAGKVKYIGIFGEQRLSKIPEVPLMNTVVPGANVYAGWGILLPRGTAPEITKWYTDNFVRAIRSTEAQRFFADNLMFVEERELTPQGYKASMLALRRVWLPIAQKMDFSGK
jgi:tripartite-type tricarboxylate transporter receptor subunit TctC